MSKKDGIQISEDNPMDLKDFLKISKSKKNKRRFWKFWSSFNTEKAEERVLRCLDELQSHPDTVQSLQVITLWRHGVVNSSIPETGHFGDGEHFYYGGYTPDMRIKGKYCQDKFWDIIRRLYIKGLKAKDPFGSPLNEPFVWIYHSLNWAREATILQNHLTQDEIQDEARGTSNRGHYLRTLRADLLKKSRQYCFWFDESPLVEILKTAEEEELDDREKIKAFAINVYAQKGRIADCYIMRVMSDSIAYFCLEVQIADYLRLYLKGPPIPKTRKKKR